MPVYVLDSNAIIDILRKNEIVLGRLTKTLAQNARFLLCPIVYYEVYRGLMDAGAERQVAAFREIRRRLATPLDLSTHSAQFPVSHSANL